jgi:hypothetical protein
VECMKKKEEGVGDHLSLWWVSVNWAKAQNFAGHEAIFVIGRSTEDRLPANEPKKCCGNQLWCLGPDADWEVRS